MTSSFSGAITITSSFITHELKELLLTVRNPRIVCLWALVGWFIVSFVYESTHSAVNH